MSVADDLAAYVTAAARCPAPDIGLPAPPAGAHVGVDDGLRVVVVTPPSPVPALPLTGPGTEGAPLPWPEYGTLRPVAYAAGPPAAVVAYRGIVGTVAVAVRWPPEPGPQDDLVLDGGTGRLTVNRRTVGPGTTRLAADVLGGHWSDMHTGWAWEHVEHETRDGGTWHVSLGFEGRRLAEVDLSHRAPGERDGWEHWSKEREDAALERHDAWLRHSVGRRRELDWGTVWSGYDDRAGYSAIHIRYPEPSGIHP
jgi:hypothetical protein